MAQDPDSAALASRLQAIWGTAPGLARLTAVNHHTLGLRFILAALVFFAIGGGLGLLMRAQLAGPASPFMTPEVYARVFTMHGTVMMFLFAIPLAEGIAMVLIPKMIGARDMAFPRLSALGWWCYLFGGTAIVGGLAIGIAPAAGWFMYTPLSSDRFSPGLGPDLWLLGITFIEISALSVAVELIVTILMLRAPGMKLMQMPVFAWVMLVVAAMILAGFPPLILASLLLEGERALGLAFFDPERGGDPLLWQHLFWLFGHPEVYIIFLPAAGMVSTMIPVLARNPLFARPLVIAGVIAIGVFSFGLWVHHMFATGLPLLSFAFFSAASAMVAVPTGMQVFAWIATLAGGRPRPSVPLLFIGGFLFIFVAGGLTGVMLAMVPFNLQAHDTQFVVAHLHYVLVGGFLFPVLAALYYWIPLVHGRRADGPLARLGAWLILIGFNGAFLLMHLTGLLGMPRRMSQVPAVAHWEWLNLISSVGAFVMAFGLAVILTDLILTIRHGRRSRSSPWGRAGLEWGVARLPAPIYNFLSQPQVDGEAERLSPAALRRVTAHPGGWLGRTDRDRQETLITGGWDGAPAAVLILPRPSWWPLITGGLIALMFALALAKLPALMAAAALAAVASLLRWPHAIAAQDAPPLPARPGAALPDQRGLPQPPSLLGLRLIMLGDAALLASLVFGGLFLALSALDPEGAGRLDLARPGTLQTGAWVAAAILSPLTLGAVMARLRPGACAAALTLACTAAALALMLGAPAIDQARASALAAVQWALHAHAGALLVPGVALAIWSLRGIGDARPYLRTTARAALAAALAAALYPLALAAMGIGA